MLFLPLSALLIQAPPPPPANEPRPSAATCAARDQSLPPRLAPWRTPSPAGGTVQPGATVTLSPSAPLTLEISEAGTYGIAIDQGAWIDVARDGASLHSAAHGHGPDCSTMRKIVDFALVPGSYTITLSRTDAPSVRLLVFRR